MEKLRMQTENLVEENIEYISKKFPNCIIESKDEQGRTVKKVDFEILKQELSRVIVEDRKERYQMTWPDKKQAIMNANKGTRMTLRPCREESVDYEKTENVYIEGDNLEVLKILRATYMHKVKMIYIDPPYNTGNDFIYKDNFAKDREEYLQESGQVDEDGNRMMKNQESNGRFHTDWLNMIYPRLRVAKDLLTDDGVFLISMADNEIANQLKVCEEIFGKDNIEIFVWKKKGGAGNTEKIIGVLTEYIVCCFKNKKPSVLNYQKSVREYKFKDEKGEYNLEGIEKSNLGTYERKTMQFEIIDPKTGQVFTPSKNMRWTIGKESVAELIKNGNLYFDYDTMKVKRIKRAEDYEQSQNVFYNLLLDEGSLASAKDECEKLLGNRELFDTPKPIDLLKKLLKICSKKDSVILDFFSGSATTAHAVMQLNAEDNGKRKFILVQLPEKCEEKSEAYKAGYKDICEIGKERIRRAGKKIKEEYPNATNLDTGFRVFKIDSSNMKDCYYYPEQITQDMLSQFEDNIEEDRTAEDLLIQVMLEIGIELSSKIERIEIEGKTIYKVNDNKLVCCFEANLTEKVVTEIAKLQPEYAVFRDSSTQSDSKNIYFEQIFKRNSPNTIRKVL